MKMVVLAALVLGLTSAAVQAVEEARLYAGHLPGAAPGNVVVVQVLDGITGRPVDGVSVRFHQEWAGTGFTGAELLGQTVTDAFGLASLAWNQRPSDAHWIFEKPGYAVHEEYGSSPPARVWLRPGREISCRLLDPLGRPAAGATVEWILGCGHSPAVRIARTSAEGLFRLQDVAPEEGRTWIRMAGAMADYFDVPSTQGTIVMEPGTTIRGTVVDGNGEAVDGVVVASLQRQRGPTAVTDGSGRFQLEGVEPAGEVWIFHPSWSGSERPFLILTDVDLPEMEAARPPLRLILPPMEVEDSDEYREFLAPDAFALPIRVVGESGEDLPDVPLSLLSLRTGLGALDEEEIDNDYESTGRRVIHVEPGDHLVDPLSPFSSYRITSPTRVTIARDQEEAIVASAVRQPVLELTGVAEALEDAEFRLVLSYASTAFDAFAVDEPVHLPATEEAVVCVQHGATVRYFPVGPAHDGVRTAAIGDVPVPEPVEGEERPDRGGVGGVRLLDAVGRPLANRAVRIERLNHSSWGDTDEDGWFGAHGQSFRASGGGYAYLPAKYVVSPCILEVEGYVTRAVTVEEPGDLTVQFPAGAIEITVADRDGTPLDFGWCVDGMTGKARDGKTTLRGVEPGRRYLVVGAAGYGSQLFVVDVPNEGALAARVVLEP